MAILLALLTPPAAGAASLKTVRYRGYSVRVPASWPVFRLRPGARTCVRFDRHAVYLGAPSAAQSCPSHAAGRTEAILIAPAPGARAAFSAQLAAAPAQSATATGRETRLARGAVTVTATWAGAPQVIRTALHVRSLDRSTASVAPSARAALAHASFRAQARRHAAGGIYTGPGFDTCSTPSLSAMSAWNSSAYRGVGIYIGGANSACAQPNLNANWTATESAAGWHMVPIYVGLQAPSNSCGCAGISPAQATSQGTAAAEDAVTQAQAVGLGAGSPIYNDMEGYARTTANTNAVMNFLAAWTTQLHAEGYLSGVYSSGGSGVADLAARYGTGYAEPDDIWVADWNNSASTADPYIPTADWTDHQRLHQYRGAHNESYGGTTINIDSDYIDGATAGGATATPAAAPSLSVNPTAGGTIQLAASWPGVSGIATWRTLGGSSMTALGQVGSDPVSGATTTIAEHSAFPYYAIQAVDANGQVLGTSATVTTRPHVALYGRSAYVPRTGVTGVPAGCFTGAACTLSVTVTAGRRTLARTGGERMGAGTGLVFFTLNSTGRRLLNHASHARLPVRITIRDSSGRSASTPINLIPYTTVGSGPRRSGSRARGMRVLGLRDFVLRGSTGGILAACSGAVPCLVATTITAGHHTVASTAPEFVGANAAAYLSYRLTGYGRALLAAAKGNQLGAQVTLTNGVTRAIAHISLSSYR